MNMGQDRQMQMNVENQVVQNAFQNPRVQNVGNQNRLIVVQGIANQNPNGNGNVVAARAEGNANGIMQASTSKEQYTELLEPIHEPHQVQQNDSNVISEVSSVEQDGGKVKQHPATVEETQKSTISYLQEENKKMKSDFKIQEDELLDKQIQLENKIKELDNILVKTGQSIQMMHMLSPKPDKFYNTEQKMALGIKILFISSKEIHKIVKYEIFPIVNKVDARVQNFEIQFLKEAAKFVRDFKSLSKKANESLAKHKDLEFEIERLLIAVVSQDIMSIVQNPTVVETSDLQTELERTKERFENCIIKKENEYAKLWNDWYRKCEECKYDKISYDKAYNDMQQNIEWLQAQLGDLKGKCKDTPCVSDTLDSMSPKLENENIELEFQIPPKVVETNDLSNPITSNSIPTPTELHVVKNDEVIAPGMLGMIPRYGDLQWGNIFITRVYFIDGLGHNLFMVGQFGDSDLEVAFRRNTYFVKNLDGVDLLKGNRTTNFYTINLHDMASTSPICLMAHATSTKSWLWHQRLSHLNFDIINDLARNDLVIGLPKFKYHKEHLYPSCEQRKSKRASHPPKPIPNSKQRLHLLHIDLYGPMRIESINRKRVYNRRTKKIIETMNVTFNELSALAFEQSSLKPELQSMTSRKITMYDDYIGGYPSAALRTVPAAQAPQVLQTPTTSTTIADTAMTPTNSSSQATNFLNTS
ncbi:retrovirus-related pol polyprotein from transposon TNT 1-94 [Tanacetum coccineum]|uniref:Retrovirus-related pol polyprotein from transposon TNT 1-94 n=1 Tax=Tanacetum coccineum TaxID=301880 RepID=A0ABQ5DXR9_9ASTR